MNRKNSLKWWTQVKQGRRLTYQREHKCAKSSVHDMKVLQKICQKCWRILCYSRQEYIILDTKTSDIHYKRSARWNNTTAKIFNTSGKPHVAKLQCFINKKELPLQRCCLENRFLFKRKITTCYNWNLAGICRIHWFFKATRTFNWRWAVAGGRPILDVNPANIDVNVQRMFSKSGTLPARWKHKTWLR